VFSYGELSQSIIPILLVSSEQIYDQLIKEADEVGELVVDGEATVLLDEKK
jgi:hypothetical protein